MIRDIARSVREGDARSHLAARVGAQVDACGGARDARTPGFHCAGAAGPGADAGTAAGARAAGAGVATGAVGMAGVTVDAGVGATVAAGAGAAEAGAGLAS